MAEMILCVGAPGTGKSTAMRNLNPTETFVINVAEKPLPIKGYKKNYTPFTTDKEKGSTGNVLNSSNAELIAKVMKHVSDKRPEIKQIIVDDSGYVMGFSNMDKVKDKGFDKFVDMAKEFYTIIKTASGLREDLRIVFNGHEENVGDALNPKRKFKTVGRLLDNAIAVEGLFTYVFFTYVHKDDDSDKITYSFITNNDGTTTAKSPMGCFDEVLVDNDWELIFNKIDEYNNG